MIEEDLFDFSFCDLPNSDHKDIKTIADSRIMDENLQSVDVYERCYIIFGTKYNMPLQLMSLYSSSFLWIFVVIVPW